MHPHSFLDARLQERQPRGVVERDHFAFTSALPPRLSDFVLCALPTAGETQQVVHEALQAGRDGVGAGADVGGGERLETAFWFVSIIRYGA